MKKLIAALIVIFIAGCSNFGGQDAGTSGAAGASGASGASGTSESGQRDMTYRSGR